MDKVYWASKPTKEVAKEIADKWQSYKDYMAQSGMITDLKKSFNTYYYRPHIQDLDQSLKAIHINQYANSINNVHTMVTSTRPAWEPRAINTDVASQNNTQLASGLLDFYMREKHIEKKLSKTVLQSLILKEGWISLDWNTAGGEVYGMDENDQPIYEGDIEIETHTILDVARDVLRRDMAHEWLIVRKWRNKWDLAAKYPELADKIIALRNDDKYGLEYELNITNLALKAANSDQDLIPVYHMYHGKTASMPQGRLVVTCDADVTLFDGPLPYKKPYIFPISPSEWFENAFGHSQFFDLLPVQDALDLCVSSILTNVAANGVQNFQVPKGAAPKVTSLKDGMNVLEYDPKAGKLEPLELLKTAPEVYNFATYLQNQGELLANTPPITKGIAPASMSGTAMALLQQQALQAASGLQLNYTILLENVGTALIELLQTYAVAPRVAMISGKAKRSMLKTFTQEDLKGIGRVMVDTANPLTKTAAGRMEIANQLLQSQLIKTPEQYIGVLTTGNLEPLYQHDNLNRMLTANENEALMQGQDVQVLLTDDDAIHILEHQCVLASPEARQDPGIVQATLAHIQAHIDNGKMKDPALAMALKQTPMQQAMPPMPMQGVEPMPQVNEPTDVNLPEPAQPPPIM
jgi:hypothetical protein